MVNDDTVYYLGTTLVATRCFVHQELGNVHIGERFVCEALVRIRNQSQPVPVCRKYGFFRKAGRVLASDVRKEMKPRA